MNINPLQQHEKRQNDLRIVFISMIIIIIIILSNGLNVFISMLSMNFYVVFTMLLTLCSATFFFEMWMGFVVVIFYFVSDYNIIVVLCSLPFLFEFFSPFYTFMYLYIIFRMWLHTDSVQLSSILIPWIYIISISL